MDKKNMADFFRNFSALLGSGVRVTDALAKCAKQSYMKDGAAIVEQMRKAIREGRSLGGALLEIGFPRDYIGYFNIGEFEGKLDRTMADLADALDADAKNDPEFELSTVEKDSAAGLDDEKTVKLVDGWIKKCVKANAGALHIIPVKGYGAVVKYRAGQRLENIDEIDSQTATRVTSRVKFMSCLDIAERRLPQDGRIIVRIDGRDHDIRVSTVPVILGEKITMRFVHKNEAVIGLDKLCLDDGEMKTVRRILEKPYGMFFIGGRSGSGKTTTCYSVLNEFIEKGLNVVTIEQPFDYLLNGATQISLDPSIGLDEAAALKTAMRTDPDVIFIGEFRDPKVIGLAINAAQTGHVVVAQFHADDAAGLLATLIGMEGVEPAMLANIINGAMAQALLRKLCDCKTKERNAALLKKHRISSACASAGCEKCLNSGYKGLRPVYEIIEFGHEMKEAIAKKDPAKLRKLLAKTLEKRALELVAEGVTSIDEVYRVFGII